MAPVRATSASPQRNACQDIWCELTRFSLDLTGFFLNLELLTAVLYLEQLSCGIVELQWLACQDRIRIRVKCLGLGLGLGLRVRAKGLGLGLGLGFGV